MRYATKWLLKSFLLSSMLLLTVLALAHGGHDKGKQDSTHHATVSAATALSVAASEHRGRTIS